MDIVAERFTLYNGGKPLNQIQSLTGTKYHHIALQILNQPMPSVLPTGWAKLTPNYKGVAPGVFLENTGEQAC